MNAVVVTRAASPVPPVIFCPELITTPETAHASLYVTGTVIDDDDTSAPPLDAVVYEEITPDAPEYVTAAAETVSLTPFVRSIRMASVPPGIASFKYQMET